MINYVLQFVKEDKTLLDNLANYEVIINSLALMDRLPEDWDALKNDLIEATCLNSKKNTVWIKLAANLAHLDIYRPDCLRKAFNQDYLEKLSKKREFNHTLNYSMVKPKTRPSESLVESV